jgi:hypothetical protein
MTKVAGTDLSYIADIKVYLKTENQETVNEVDELVKNMKL